MQAVIGSSWKSWCKRRGLSNSSTETTRSRIDYNRQYYLQTEEKKKDSARRYYAQNEDREKALKRGYRLENGDKRREYGREYHVRKLQNPETYVPRSTANKSWKTPELVRAFFDSIAKQLHILEPSDWYRISNYQIIALGGQTLYRKFAHLGLALHYAYPEIDWNMCRFSAKGKKTGQRWLRVTIEELLPGIEIVEDYKHPDVSWELLGAHVELDLWLPKYQIGIEYQGEQHYHSLDTAFGPNGMTNVYGERDQLKRALCIPQGITLISIPYWWDGSKESLSATLFQARPDVFPASEASPIPHNRPQTASRYLE